ncbi:hypothetical protein KFU94_36240 [Chloroflexi bacterium TSY]|nr:hypothetical protein [Chloroflexi bacterium TSY]
MTEMDKDNKERLLETLRNASYEKWRQLATGSFLFDALREMVRDRQVNEARFSLKESQPFIGDWYDQMRQWWTFTDAIVTCAEIAEIDRRNWRATASLHGRLRHFDQNIVTPVQTNGQATLTKAQWQELVRQTFYSMRWPQRLSASWAWDLMTYFWGSPQPAEQEISISVLLVTGDK